MIQKAAPQRVVILVDGDPMVVSTVRRALHDEPVELRATANPHRALKWLEELDAPLILADPDMPAVQESNLLRIVEERFPGTICALLSAGPVETPLGPPRVATKPWDPGRVERAVRDLLHREAAIPFVVPEERPEAAVSMQTMNVLLVHAGPSGPSALETALREEGFATRVAQTGGEALDLLRAAPLGTDVVLLPPQLTGTSAAALIREMVRLSPGLAVILYPGDWTRDEIRAAYEAGAMNVAAGGEDPANTVTLILRSARHIHDRRAAALRKKEERERNEKMPHRLVRNADAPRNSRAGKIRLLVLVGAAGLLIGSTLAWVTDLFVTPEPPVSATDRVLNSLERALARDPFHESEFQRWYLRQRLDLERQTNYANRQTQDDLMKSNRLDALLRDLRPAELPRR